MIKKLVFCKCGGERINSDRLQSIEKNLAKLNIGICILSDLCKLSVVNKNVLTDVFNDGKEYLVIGCYERSLKLILEQVGINYDKISLAYINMLESDDTEIFQKVSFFCENSNQTLAVTEIDTKSDWLSWFPVIDYSRCSGCGQCADFCLFGVFEKREGRVNVVNPMECKNNCPACARICPQTAIIFPKYKFGGAIGGSEIIDEIAEHSRQANDINLFLKGDIYSALEQRKNKRRSIIRTEAMNKAIEERDNELKKT
jgi:NAD-dependent dihydropyrimidine dehydrogenase PreA subunit